MASSTSQPPETPVRAAEVVAALSLATDLGSGQPLEHALRTAILAVGIATAGSLSSAGPAWATPQDGIVAIVASQPILVSEVDERVRSWRAQWRAEGMAADAGYTEAALFDKALEMRINELLLFAEGQRVGIAITPAMIDAAKKATPTMSSSSAPADCVMSWPRLTSKPPR